MNRLHKVSLVAVLLVVVLGLVAASMWTTGSSDEASPSDVVASGNFSENPLDPNNNAPIAAVSGPVQTSAAKSATTVERGSSAARSDVQSRSGVTESQPIQKSHRAADHSGAGSAATHTPSVATHNRSGASGNQSAAWGNPLTASGSQSAGSASSAPGFAGARSTGRSSAASAGSGGGAASGGAPGQKAAASHESTGSGVIAQSAGVSDARPTETAQASGTRAGVQDSLISDLPGGLLGAPPPAPGTGNESGNASSSSGGPASSGAPSSPGGSTNSAAGPESTPPASTSAGAGSTAAPPALTWSESIGAPSGDGESTAPEDEVFPALLRLLDEVPPSGAPSETTETSVPGETQAGTLSVAPPNPLVVNPEPGTLLLLGTGLFAAGRRMRRR